MYNIFLFFSGFMYSYVFFAYVINILYYKYVKEIILKWLRVTYSFI
jgi:hypothetical protein